MPRFRLNCTLMAEAHEHRGVTLHVECDADDDTDAHCFVRDLFPDVEYDVSDIDYLSEEETQPAADGQPLPTLE